MGEQGRGQGLGHNLEVPTEDHGASPRLPDHVLFSAREQRVTGTIVFILTGISVFLAPILKVRPCTLPQGAFCLGNHWPDAPKVGQGPHMAPKKAVFY